MYSYSLSNGCGITALSRCIAFGRYEVPVLFPRGVRGTERGPRCSSMDSQHLAGSAASVVREDLNAKVDVLLNEGIQRQLDAHQRRENLTTFYLWDTAWGYWPSFVNGFVSGLGHGFRRDGDCSQEQGDHSRVSCRIVFSDLQLHYHITVAVKDKSLEETQQTMNPVLRADGGELVAKVKNGRAVLMLRKNLGKNLRVS